MVKAKCAHLGRAYYIPIWFPVYCEDGKTAAAKVREFKRVKRNHKDAIIDVIQVDEETFVNQLKINDSDPYLHFKSRHEQNENFYLIKDRIVPDPHILSLRELRKHSRRPNLYYQAQKYKIIDDYQDEIDYLK